MRLVLIDVPYDCGRHEERMGAGPTFLLARGLAESLRADGHEVTQRSAHLPSDFHTEWQALTSLQRQVAAHAREAFARGERVLVLSGNCGPAALGCLGALASDQTAVCWFDAHADFNTPETSPSGFLDGMAAAICVGDCWRGPARALDSFSPLPEEHLIFIGPRALDPPEADRLNLSHVRRLDGRDLTALDRTLFQNGVRQLYVHIDLDVLDPAALRANEYAAPGGLNPDQVLALVKTAASQLPMLAAAITALDPAIDERAWPVTEQIARGVAREFR